MSSTWIHQVVRHVDGRNGLIVEAERRAAATDLFIEVSGGVRSFVRLHHIGSDSGEAGWYWQLQGAEGQITWLPLGHHDHKGRPLV